MNKLKEILKKLVRDVNSNKILLVILLFALSLRLVFFTELQNKNDCWYAKAATIMANGSIELEDFQAYRIGHIIPTAFFIKLFGANKWSYSIFPLISALGFIILVYLITERIFDRKSGLLASFIASILPINIFFSTIPNSDVTLMFYIGLSVLFFMKGYESQTSNRYRSKIHFILCGLFLGVAYLTKIYSGILIVFYAVYLIVKRQVRLRYFTILIGLFAVLIAEGTFYYIMNGDFFSRINRLTRIYRPVHNVNTSFPPIMDAVKNPPKSSLKPITNAKLELLKRKSMDEILALPSTMFNPFNDFFPRLNLIFYFTFFGLIYALLTRSKDALFPSTWIITNLLLVIFLGRLKKYITTDGETHYIFMRFFGFHARYLYPVLIPSMAISAWAFFEGKKIRLFKPFFYLGMALMILLSLFGIYILNLDNQIRYYNINQIKEFVDSHRDKKVFTDYRTKNYLDCLYYFEDTDNILKYNYIDTPPIGSYVILNRSLMGFLKYEYNIPPNWERIKAIIPRARKSIRNMILGRGKEEDLDMSYRSEVYLVK